MSDPTYQPKVYFDQGGDRLTVASGGTLVIEEGAAVTAGGSNLFEEYLHLDIADGSAEAVYYLLSPVAGTITNIQTVTDGAVSTADITITGKIGSTAITNGVVTIATSGSAAGDVDSAQPTAANVITAGAAVNFTVTGGGAGGSPRIHLVMTVAR